MCPFCTWSGNLECKWPNHCTCESSGFNQAASKVTPQIVRIGFLAIYCDLIIFGGVECQESMKCVESDGVRLVVVFPVAKNNTYIHHFGNMKFPQHHVKVPRRQRQGERIKHLQTKKKNGTWTSKKSSFKYIGPYICAVYIYIHTLCICKCSVLNVHIWINLYIYMCVYLHMCRLTSTCIDTMDVHR